MILPTMRSAGMVAALIFVGGVLAGCGGGSAVKGEYPYKQTGRDPVYAEGVGELDSKRNTVFGEGGLSLGGNKKASATEGGTGIGVNSFLWRASLDTIAFMPVTSADPFGGVIITDWYTPPQTPSERFKLNVYILGRSLRADGVRVAVFRQVQDGSTAWRDATIPTETATNIENAILMRARQLRNETVQR